MAAVAVNALRAREEKKKKIAPKQSQKVHSRRENL